jgi:hypothetical protein
MLSDRLIYPKPKARKDMLLKLKAGQLGRSLLEGDRGLAEGSEHPPWSSLLSICHGNFSR